jgi:ribosome-associated protein
MIQVTSIIAISENELKEEFIRSSGPGGQNVNKVSTAVRLRFDAANSPSLPDAVKNRLKTLAGKRLTEEGILIIDARRFRTQEANRKNALERLVELLRDAAEEPQIRHQTRPTYGSKLRRLESKHHHTKTKQARRADIGEE